MNRKERRAAAAEQRKKGSQRLKVEDAVMLAMGLHREGELEQAESVYQQILEAVPDNSNALHYYGVLRHQMGASDEAISLIQRSIAIDASHPDTFNNLGNVLKERGKAQEAADAYRSCLKLAPRHADAMSNLGGVLRQCGELDEAVEVLQRAIELNPDNAGAHHNLGNVYKKLDRTHDAIEAYRTAIAKMHDSSSTGDVAAVYESLTRVLYTNQQHDEVVSVLRQWLDYDADNPTASHMLAACTGENIPDRAADGYVREMFDAFSGTFDEVLEGLQYRAPELVNAAIDRHMPVDGDRQSVVLDAGCGTGLCADFLVPIAAQLIGVDLSTKMIEKAKGRGAYDELVAAELTAYLTEHQDQFDLIVSADTLCYFGELADVLRAASRALKDQGRLIFTLEKLVDPAAGETFRLNPHGRYSHAGELVAGVLAENDLKVLEIVDETLRFEAGEPVAGMVVSAARR